MLNQNNNHLDDLEELSLQLNALVHTMDVLQSQFEIQRLGEDVISSRIMLNNATCHIKEEVYKKIVYLLKNR